MDRELGVQAAAALPERLEQVERQRPIRRVADEVIERSVAVFVFARGVRSVGEQHARRRVVVVLHRIDQWNIAASAVRIDALREQKLDDPPFALAVPLDIRQGTNLHRKRAFPRLRRRETHHVIQNSIASLVFFGHRHTRFDHPYQRLSAMRTGRRVPSGVATVLVFDAAVSPAFQQQQANVFLAAVARPTQRG